MKKTTVLFDLDGTLLDSLGGIVVSVNTILEKHGFPTLSKEEVCAATGNGAHHLIAHCLPEGTPEEQVLEVLTDYLPYYEAHCQEVTKPFAGIPELLQNLTRQGYHIGVLSNKPDGATKKLCAQWFPGVYAQGQTDTIRRKPYPDMVDVTLEKWHCKKEDAVYVGDSEVDVATAINAGMDGIAVLWGFRSKYTLEQAGATVFVHTPEEIEEVIRSEG